jgi:hypothetical protein
MTLRPAPTAATWILKLFCHGPELETMEGDLMEEYQRGRSAFWYWRQVLNIVVLGLYRKPGNSPLVATDRFPMGAVFAVLLLIAVVSALVLSPLLPIFLIVTLAGVVIGGLRLLHKDGTAKQTPEGPQLVRIDSSKISVGGGLGAGLIILVLLSAVLHDLAPLRILAAPGLLAGLLFAVILRYWRRTHPPEPPVALGLTDSTGTETKHR